MLFIIIVIIIILYYYYYNYCCYGNILFQLSGSCDASVVSSLYVGDFKKVFCINRLVWGKLPGFCWWPGAIISYASNDSGQEAKEKTTVNNKQKTRETPSAEDSQHGSEVTSVWVKWFGENQLSLVIKSNQGVVCMCTVCVCDVLGIHGQIGSP